MCGCALRDMHRLTSLSSTKAEEDSYSYWLDPLASSKSSTYPHQQRERVPDAPPPSAPLLRPMTLIQQAHVRVLGTGLGGTRLT